MQLELCLNPTLQSSPASAVKPEARPKPPLPVATAGSVAGRKRHNAYLVWKSMRNRCRNPNNKDFRYYGGRGISICERWNDFWLFAKDMGPRPTSKHEIDRINNEGNYEPGNCKWSTRTEQLQHTRRNVYIQYGGTKLTLSCWAKKLGIAIETLRERFKREWPIEVALSSQKHRPGNGKKAWEIRRRNLRNGT
jgi:hypothetical protein